MEIAWAIGPFLAGLTGGLLAARVARERADESGIRRKRMSVGGTGAAVLVVLGTAGLGLTAIVVVSRDEPIPAASILFAAMLALGLYDHYTQRRRVP